jgi:hypothetical protein
VDAKGSFDHFGDRIVDADTRDIDAPIVSTLPDINGDFFLVARAPLPEDKFFNFRGTFVFHPVTENTGEYDWSSTALDWQTFEPVGQTFVADNVQVSSDATADMPLVGDLDGRANSVSGSMVTFNDTVVHVTIVNADFMCGTLTGDASGFPLAGSTFGAVRITGDTLPAPIHNCEGGPPPSP